MKYTSTILLIGALLLSACSNQAVYTGESFSSDSPFRMRADGDVAMACESARRALLGQGYLIEGAGGESVKGRKAYNTQDTQNTFIEMNIACLSDASGSTLYATGVVTTYALKKSSSSASVGVSALGSISLPIGQSADSLVKISEATIDDKDFYKRFFSAVDIILGEMRASTNITAPVAPEPGPAPESVAAPIATPVTVPVPEQPAAVQAAPVQPPPTAVAEPDPAPVVAPQPPSTPAVVPVVTTAPAQTKQAAATRAPTPEDQQAKPIATQAPPKTVLEEFAAPRATPY